MVSRSTLIKVFAPELVPDLDETAKQNYREYWAITDKGSRKVHLDEMLLQLEVHPKKRPALYTSAKSFVIDRMMVYRRRDEREQQKRRRIAEIRKRYRTKSVVPQESLNEIHTNVEEIEPNLEEDYTESQPVEEEHDPLVSQWEPGLVYLDQGNTDLVYVYNDEVCVQQEAEQGDHLLPSDSFQEEPPDEVLTEGGFPHEGDQNHNLEEILWNDNGVMYFQKDGQFYVVQVQEQVGDIEYLV